MQHAHILPSHDMNQLTRLNMTNLNETRLKCQDIRVVQRKRLRCPFPGDLPIRSSAPAISIDEEAEVRVVEQELPVETFYVYGLDILLARDKVERGVGLVEQ